MNLKFIVSIFFYATRIQTSDVAGYPQADQQYRQARNAELIQSSIDDAGSSLPGDAIDSSEPRSKRFFGSWLLPTTTTRTVTVTLPTSYTLTTSVITLRVTHFYVVLLPYLLTEWWWYMIYIYIYAYWNLRSNNRRAARNPNLFPLV